MKKQDFFIWSWRWLSRIIFAMKQFFFLAFKMTVVYFLNRACEINKYFFCNCEQYTGNDPTYARHCTGTSQIGWIFECVYIVTGGKSCKNGRVINSDLKSREEIRGSEKKISKSCWNKIHSLQLKKLLSPLLHMAYKHPQHTCTGPNIRVVLLFRKGRSIYIELHHKTQILECFFSYMRVFIWSLYGQFASQQHYWLLLVL